MKNPPILVAILGFFAALAGFGFLFFGLRVIGFDWFGALGDLPAIEHVGLWGWLAVFTGIVWLLAALGLWSLQPWARLFAMIIAGIALFEAVLAFFQFPGTGTGFAMAIMPVLILWYLGTADVKAAFGVGASTAAPEAGPAPVAMAAPMAAAAPAPAPVAAAPVVAAPVAAAAVVAAAAPAEPAEPAEPEGGVAPEASHHMGIEDVEGIGPAQAEKLAAVGITTTQGLLTAGAKRYDRERIAEATGISSDLIRDWVNKIDLMRVPGVGPQYSDLLELAGVDSPAELAQRNPSNLFVTLQEVVAARPDVVRRLPTEGEVASWVAEAGKLDHVVEH